MNKTEKLVKIASFLLEHNIQNATINDDFTVDVEGDVYLSSKNLNEIPIQFGRVSGYFDISYNNFTSLKGCPREVGGDFYCYVNQLTTLEYVPMCVGGSFYCEYNNLKTLMGCPNEVGGNFYCKRNPHLKSLKGIGRVDGFIYSDIYEGILKYYKGEL